MATSTLDPALDPRRDRSLGTGHGTEALGPSDTSDSGSDVHGGGAGSRIGDAELDSDTDSAGTGEHKTAGRDAKVSDGKDIDTDQVESIADLPAEEMPEDTPEDDSREADRKH
jgi:hypothetical protein